MLGFTTGEGMLFDLFGEGVSDCERVIPWYFGYEHGQPDTKIVGEQIKRFYFGDEDLSPTTKAQKYDVSKLIKYFWG